MNELLPIIRRVRRPLLVEDKPPVVAGNVEPANANAEAGAQNAESKSEAHEPTQPTTDAGPD